VQTLHDHRLLVHTFVAALRTTLVPTALFVALIAAGRLLVLSAEPLSTLLIAALLVAALALIATLAAAALVAVALITTALVVLLIVAVLILILILVRHDLLLDLASEFSHHT
jgi:hypothetical protein